MNRLAVYVLHLTVLIVTVAAACCAQQAAGQGTVTGSVTGSGVPVVGVRVTIVSAVSSFAPSTVSDEKGNFTFTGMPLGGVTVKVLDPKGNVLASATGTLRVAGEVLSIPVNVP